LAFTSYNLLKSVFVYRKYGLQPFYKETLQTTLFGLVAIGSFFFWDFPFHPLVNIVLKSLLVGAFWVWVLVKFRLSKELIKILK
jgi:polysaccharide biosynthesis protein